MQIWLLRQRYYVYATAPVTALLYRAPWHTLASEPPERDAHSSQLEQGDFLKMTPRPHSYLNAIQHASSTNESVLLDRSVFSDWVFAVKNNEDGNIKCACHTAARCAHQHTLVA